MPNISKVKILLSIAIVVFAGAALIFNKGSWSKRIVPFSQSPEQRAENTTPQGTPSSFPSLEEEASLAETNNARGEPSELNPQIASLVDPVLDAVLQNPDAFLDAKGDIQTAALDDLVNKQGPFTSFDPNVSHLITREDAVTVTPSLDNALETKRAFIKRFETEPLLSLSNKILTFFDAYPSSASTEENYSLLMQLVGYYNALLKEMGLVPVPPDWKPYYARIIAALMTQRNGYTMVAHAFVTNPLNAFSGVKLVQEGARLFYAAETELRERANAEGAL